MNQPKAIAAEAHHDAYFSGDWEAKLGSPHENPEGLHDRYKKEKPHYALTATQYFGFHVPDARIHALLYEWHHPNLGVISAGPMVWRGIKPSQLSCELYDYRAYMSDSALGANMEAYRLDNGYCVEVEGAGRSFRTTYEDPSRNNSYDVRHVPVTDRLWWPSGRQFEQVMRTTGEVVLRGKRYAIDGFHVRDRSWGELRMEEPFQSPPLGWTTGVFDEGFSFMVTASDDPELNPVWKGRYNIESKDTLKFGWMVVDGTPIAVARIRKLTTYDERRFPQTVTMELTDTRGRKFEIKGRVLADSPCLAWPNCLVHICCFRWECNGQVGHGDHQEAQWTDFLQTDEN
ncbi:MAG: hypothetical protein ABW110_05385 [Steroidobacteraceae bacterium]